MNKIKVNSSQNNNQGRLIPVLVGLNLLVVLILAAVWWFSSNRGLTEESDTEKNENVYETIELNSDGQLRKVIADQLLFQAKSGSEIQELQQIIANLGAVELYDLSNDRWILYFKDEKDLSYKLSLLKAEALVAMADFDDVYFLSDLPNDYLDKSSNAPYWWEMIKMPQAWDRVRSLDLSKAAVGIADNQIESRHEDLVGAVVNYEDDSGESHGTHVAGLVSAKGDNALGVVGAGVNLVTTYGARVCYGQVCPASLIIWGLEALKSSGVRVINMSFGMSADNQVMKNIIREIDQEGVLLIAAAGNNSRDSSLYPAAYDEVISVASINSSNERSGFSNYGESVDLAAPGEDILSTTINSQYERLSGTSFSAAIVSGVSGLCLAMNPGLTSNQLRAILFQTARENEFTKYGLVDAEEMIKQCDMFNLAQGMSADQVVLGVQDGGAGAATSCVVPEWYCTGTDVLVPPVTCDAVQLGSDDATATRCQKCAERYLFPRPQEWVCPSGQDDGQKDGSSRFGGDRKYWQFDFDSGSGAVVNVPPYGFGVGGPVIQ